MWKSQTNHSVLLTSLFLVLLTTAQLTSSSSRSRSSSSSDNGCKEGEREALLKFKKSLTKSSKLLSSWKKGEQDCCKWGGVSCDNSTGHVIKLDLSASSDDSGGKQGQLKANYLDNSLLELEHLEELDLSHNDFRGTPIPSFIGSMKKLTYLDLGGAGFSGSVPIELGNLHSLVFLDLTSNALTGIEGGLWGVLSNLCSLNRCTFQIPKSMASYSQDHMEIHQN